MLCDERIFFCRDEKNFGQDQVLVRYPALNHVLKSIFSKGTNLQGCPDFELETYERRIPQQSLLRRQRLRA